MADWQPAGQIGQLSSVLTSLPPLLLKIRSSLLLHLHLEQTVSGLRKYRHTGSAAAFVLGALSLLAGLGKFTKDLSGKTSWEGSELFLPGVVSILGALAYRSAKKRRLGEVKTTPIRQIGEIAALLLIAFLVVAQNDLKNHIATQPIANFVAPVWALVAYLVAVFTPWKKTHGPQSADKQVMSESENAPQSPEAKNASEHKSGHS